MPARRPLGGGAIALIFMDVVLIGILIALFATRGAPSSGDAETTAAQTTASDSETTLSSVPAVTPPADALDVAAFALPSRNIWCEIGAEDATCYIADYTFSPPNVPDCTGTVGHVVQVTEAEASLPCSTEDAPGEASPDLTVLDYGQTSVVGDFMCTSDTDGVTCRSAASGHGFTLARGGFTLF